MPGTKELKNRIKSIGSTRKITRAMQMVSAAKMRKSQSAALNSRAYSEMAWKLISSLGKIKIKDSGEINKNVGKLNDSQRLDFEAEILAGKLLSAYPNAKKVGIIVISTNKGLVGGFNTNLMVKLNELANSAGKQNLDMMAEVIVMGKKAKDFTVRTGKKLIADFPKNDNWTPASDIYPLAQMVTNLYLTEQYSEINIVYNQFVSTLIQKVTVKRLLPFGAIKNFSKPQEKGDQENSEKSEDADTSEALDPEYLFEPSPETVLKHLLPRIIESQIYQAVLESDASEHSARMIMMKNATESAGDLISDLTLTYNQLRQGKITTELSEITAGRIALE